MTGELKGEEVSFSYHIDSLPESGKERKIIGQERAVNALKMGLRTKRSGYNIFLSGDIGTGRLTAVRQEVSALPFTSIEDVLYLHNPENISSPRAVTVSSGDGRKLKEMLSSLSPENYRERLQEIMGAFKSPSLAKYVRLLQKHPFSEAERHANLAVDRTGCDSWPLIVEAHPTHENVFGYYDKNAAWPHMGIRPGSYERAAGGFLVLTAEELLAQKGVWDSLKRHLDATQMALGGNIVEGSLGKDERVRPQPIPMYTKVILLGSDDTYDELCAKDEQFLRLFKIAPQFDYQMQATKENIDGTLSYLMSLSATLGAKTTVGGYEELLRYSSWFTEDRNTLSTQLSIIGDVLSEACSLSKDGVVDKDSVNDAIRKREYFSAITEDRINEDIKSGDIIIETSGEKIGVVNALAVMDRGLASFGTPTVISATVAPGTEGIVNIEHEAGLSGEIHDKGILILEGYLRKQYARTFPLSMYAGLCFEQNYSEIDGDSASSSELYALLSAIGELPINQGIAITGSVNQMGLLQPVGGINEKITGFYKSCKATGFTGSQGVIIPKQNVRSLILPREIENAVKDGIFHIYALGTIEEGMSLLTGMKPGARNSKGTFPVGSFNRKIEDRLRKLYEAGKSN